MSEALDAAIAHRATPLLREFNRAGALTAADVHVATRLGALAGESDERVRLAAALAVGAVRAGSVCLSLAEAPDLVSASLAAAGEAEAPAAAVAALPWPPTDDWLAACRASPMVAVGPDGDPGRPLRLVDGRLYLDRYWRHEQVLRRELDARARHPAPSLAVDTEALQQALHRLFTDPAPDRQRLAAAASALGSVTVLTGGPGTGKTTTVARLMAVLQAASEAPLRVALAAPTGKAAARLQEAVRTEARKLDAADQQRLGELRASTLHRLLGWKPGSTTRFRHDRTNHLPHDVVVVDETSMVSLTLMSRLLEALRPAARLVLVGDPDQLASVEAGAVLGDLVARQPPADLLGTALAAVVPADVPTDERARAALAGGVVRLETLHRFDRPIADLAAAIRDGRPDDAVDLLRHNAATEFVELLGGEISDEDMASVRHDAVSAGVALRTAAADGDVAGALQALERHRLLLAHRRGPAGVARWANEVERWVAQAGGAGVDEGEWYLGRPLLVTANDRDSGLFNGDTGVVVADGAGGVVAAFGTASAPLLVRPHRLPAVTTVHAMTVHRGQGSQFERVSVLLPPAESPLLSRELLYTAVTRASARVRVVGTEAAVRRAVDRPARRASGLRHPQ